MGPLGRPGPPHAEVRADTMEEARAMHPVPTMRAPRLPPQVGLAFLPLSTLRIFTGPIWQMQMTATTK